MSTITEREFQTSPTAALERASQEGGLVIRREDGSELTIRQTRPAASPPKLHPLEVGGVSLGKPMTAEEIVQLIHDARDEYDREKEANCRRD